MGRKDDKPLFMKSVFEMTDKELDEKIAKAKRGKITFKFAKKIEDIFVPKIYGKAPMLLSDEIIGGRYSPADGNVYDSKAKWMQSFDSNDIMMVDANAKLPTKKIDKISDQDYIDTYNEARRMLTWKEETVGEKETQEARKLREAMLNKYGTTEQLKPKNRRKIINGE